jgi:hypothetical protein
MHISNKQIELAGWAIFLMSSIGFIISSVGNFWSEFGSIMFFLGCLCFLIPFYRKDPPPEQLAVSSDDDVKIDFNSPVSTGLASNV